MACANRHVLVNRFGPIEVTTTFRDTRKPDGYSREELVEMLQLIRRHEALQKWRAPELKD